jgi:glycosyltransferase involved in cell wall biosynthesis
MEGAGPKRPLIFVSNFSKPGRGTFVVAELVRQLPSFEVICFDAMDERGFRGPLVTLAGAFALSRRLWRRPHALVLADTGHGIRLMGLMSRVFRRHTFVARYGNVFQPARPRLNVGGLKRRLFEEAIRRSDHVVTPSTAAKAALAAARVKPAGAISVIPNGVRFAEAHGPRFATGEPIRLRFVGRLEARKAPDMALRTLAALRASGAEAQLEYVGETDGRAGLSHLAAELGVGEYVSFRGFLADPWADVPDNCLLLHPAEFEGFGYAVLEAIGRGVPCLVFRVVGGPEEIIESTGGGTVVEERTPEAMAKAVRRLFDDPAAVAARAQAAQALARDIYSPARMVRLYDELLARLAQPDREAPQTSAASDVRAPSAD